jgi:hypothetical protein
MLTEDPVGLAARILGHVVVALHLLAVPPARLDALGPRRELERALQGGNSIRADEAMGTIE